MISLSNDFLKVKTQFGELYGGNQMRCHKKSMQGYGCGVIGCANILFYDKFKENGRPEIDEEDYLQTVERLRKRYLPVIPKFGMNGLFMAIGLNLYYLFHRSSKRARWGCFHRNVYKHIEKMLLDDEPVILSVGPNFPNLFGSKRVNLYIKTQDKYVVSCTTKAHYVTVTGIDDGWLRVSSWGEQYFINREEYTRYVKRNSNSLFSSILIIHDRKRKNS